MCQATSELFNPTLVIIYLKCNIKYAFRGAAQLPPEKFVVPRPLICSKSSYFQTLFLGESREAHSCQAQLKDFQPWVSRVLITWLYDRAIYYVAERVEPRCFLGSRYADSPKIDSPDIYSCVSGGKAWKNNQREEEEKKKKKRKGKKEQRTLSPSRAILGIRSLGHSLGYLKSMFSHIDTRFESSGTT